jgi:hypothetical protein
LQCANNLKQIALGLHNYAATFRVMPPGTLYCPGSSPEQRLSWLVDILPYLEREDLYHQFDCKEGWEAPANVAPGKAAVRTLQCPDWSREAGPDQGCLTAYVGVAGLGADAATLPANDPRAGLFGYDRCADLRAVKDGASNTLLILESARDNGPWSRGGPATVRGLDTADQPYVGVGRPFGGTHFAENTMFGRGKSVGCQGAMADGSIRFLPDGIDPKVLEALVTAAGGEPVPPGW